MPSPGLENLKICMHIIFVYATVCLHVLYFLHAKNAYMYAGIQSVYIIVVCMNVHSLPLTTNIYHSSSFTYFYKMLQLFSSIYKYLYYILKYFVNTQILCSYISNRGKSTTCYKENKEASGIENTGII